MTDYTNVHAVSEVGALKSVLLHRPGSELESLTPQYLDSMLFEDIPFLEQMQQEHDEFARVLSRHGSEVLYVESLLEDILGDRELREQTIDQLIQQSSLLYPSLRESIREYLSDKGPAELVKHLVGGLLKREVDGMIQEKTLSYYIRDAYPYYISPLPNLYFTRDPGTVAGNSVCINSMKTESRRRETWLLSLIMKHHQRFSSVPLHFAGDSSIEGGDILVAGNSTVIIGCSARTAVWAIEEFARRVTAPPEEGGQGFERVLVIQIPFTRAYMHLDTVFTMADRDKFCIFGSIEPALHQFLIQRNSRGSLRISQQRDLRQALKKVLNLPSVDLIRSGGGDDITAAREQWNDSTNTLAISPGTVVTYRRNVVSNETLERRGITVIPIRGSELVRGRGGPRCMSMPLRREA